MCGKVTFPQANLLFHMLLHVVMKRRLIIKSVKSSSLIHKYKIGHILKTLDQGPVWCESLHEDSALESKQHFLDANCKGRKVENYCFVSSFIFKKYSFKITIMQFYNGGKLGKTWRISVFPCNILAATYLVK